MCAVALTQGCNKDTDESLHEVVVTISNGTPASLRLDLTNSAAGVDVWTNCGPNSVIRWRLPKGRATLYTYYAGVKEPQGKPQQPGAIFGLAEQLSIDHIELTNRELWMYSVASEYIGLRSKHPSIQREMKKQ
jgi:hypothetical protein